MPCNPKKDLIKVQAIANFRVFPDFTRRTVLHAGEVSPARWRRHSRFYTAYLWETREDFKRNSVCTSYKDNEDSMVDGEAYCSFMEDVYQRPGWWPAAVRWVLERTVDPLVAYWGLPWTWVGYKQHVHPKLGEMHFIAGAWTLDLVAHEVFHAVSHIMRFIGPTGDECVQRAKGARFSTGCAQEDVAYLDGHLVRNVFEWLWEVDPQGRPRLNEWELP